MIDSIEALFIEIFWDLDERHCISVGGVDSFYVNKASIYKKDDEYVFEYKMDRDNICPTVFNLFSKFMKIYSASEVLKQRFYNLSLTYYDSPNREDYDFSKENLEFMEFVNEIKDLTKLI